MAVVAAQAAKPPNPPEERVNIVIIMSDDSGYSDLGCFGSEIDTPHLDKLAARGMRLTNFYTNGRCSPTRATLLSGLDCAKVGFGGGVVGGWWREMPYPAHRGRLPYDVPLLPELMKEVGYHTMMAGKWHLGGSLMKNNKGLQRIWKTYHQGWELTGDELEQDYLGLPSQRGFNEYFGIYDAQDSYFFVPGQAHPVMEGNRTAKLDYRRTYEMRCYPPPEKSKRYAENHGKVGKAFYDTDGVTDRAIEMIKDASGAEAPPFLLYLAYRAPHKPLQAPEPLVQKYLERYADIEAVMAARVQALKGRKLYPPEAPSRKLWLPEEREDFRLQLAIHAAMTEKVDENVGRVVAALEQTGELDNTLVVYFSDNGSAAHTMGAMNVPYHGVKALLWEGGLRTHFIAAWPEQIEAGSVSHEQAWVGDILPTCLAIADSHYPETFRGRKTDALAGRNMLSILKGKKRAPAEALFFNDKGQQAVIYQGRWKLLIEPGWYRETLVSPGIVYELYDLKTDPAETQNLAKQKPELVERLVKQCDAWAKECGIVDYSELVKLRPNDPS